jgi:hypothetical protein
MQKMALLFVTLSFSLLTSCASVVNGTHQTVSVLTPPERDAHCVLENNKGKWYINKTPASVVVHRSFKDLIVTCEKQGYGKSISNVKSKTKAAAFGNILLGGAIGAGVDMANGAAYEYPHEIKIPLKPSKKHK